MRPVLARTLILVPTHAWRRTLRKALPPVPGISIHTASEWIE